MSVIRIQVDNSDLVVNADRAYLNAAVTASSGTITVSSINKFAVNQILLIGEMGQEKSEIIKTHASTAPSGNTITLASNTTYAHSSNTVVYIIPYDQYELSHATSVSGSKTTLTTSIGSGIVAIDPETEETLYLDSEYTTGYYFVRKKETVGNTFSGYSDAIPATGFEANSVGYAIEQALRNNATSYTDKLTQQDCIRWINECLRFIQGKQLHFSDHQNLNYIMDQTERGVRSYTLPTDIYDNDTNRSIMGVRVGDGQNLQYIDPAEFEADLTDTLETQVRTQASASDTSLAVDNSYDFADSGTLHCYVSGTRYSITYTGVTRDDASGGTAVFTGIPASGTGSISVTIPVDTNVWQDEDEGEPKDYTIRNGNLEINPMPDSKNDNENIYLDYYTEATEVDTDGDTLDLTRYELIVDWLSWQVRMRVKNEGALDMSDGYYRMFKEKLNDAIKTSRPQFVSKMKPRINKISFRSARQGYKSQE